MYQQKVDVDMLNTVENYGADVLKPAITRRQNSYARAFGATSEGDSALSVSKDSALRAYDSISNSLRENYHYYYCFSLFIIIIFSYFSCGFLPVLLFHLGNKSFPLQGFAW